MVRLSVHNSTCLRVDNSLHNAQSLAFYSLFRVDFSRKEWKIQMKEKTGYFGRQHNYVAQVLQQFHNDA